MSAVGIQSIAVSMGGLSVANHTTHSATSLVRFWSLAESISHSFLALMVKDTSNKILTPVKHVTMYLRLSIVVVPVNSSKVVGWPSSKEPKEKGTQDHMRLSRECNLVIVIYLKLKADPYVSLTKTFFFY